MNDEQASPNPEKVLNDFEKDLNSALDRLKGELTKIRTGRASTALVDGIKVEVYGQNMPISQLAQVSVESAKTIKIEPWDKNNCKPIADAIMKSELGVNPNNTGEVVRIVLPDLTQERKNQFTKIVKTHQEEARAKMRKSRNDYMKKLSRQKDLGLSEDREVAYKKKLDELFKHKESEAVNLTEAKIKEILS